jgi:hypothetical protein
MLYSELAIHACFYSFAPLASTHVAIELSSLEAGPTHSRSRPFPVFPVLAYALFYNNCVSFLKKYISQIAKCIFSSLTKRMHAKCKR